MKKVKKLIGRVTNLFKKKQKPRTAPEYEILLIDIENTTEETKRFELFGAYVNVFDVKDGVLDRDGVKIENAIIIDGYASYGDILWKSIKEEICISKSYLTLLSGKFNNNYKGLFTIITSLPDGKRYERLLMYYQDPYQYQKDIFQNNEEIKIDGFTKIVGEIEPKTKIRLTLLLSKNENLHKSRDKN